MKKTILSILVIALFCSTQLYAQGVRYGFKAGVNYSQISGYEFDVINVVPGENPIDAFGSVEDGRYGFSAAFLAEIPLGDVLSFQPEFAFSSQGNKFEGVRFDYLQLPLGLRLNFNKLFVIAGPQAGIKISSFEQSENFTSLDFSGFGAIGYHFTESIFIEARFTRGFMEIFEDDAAIRLPYVPGDGEPAANDNSLVNGNNFLDNNTGNNQYFTFSIGYRL